MKTRSILVQVAKKFFGQEFSLSVSAIWHKKTNNSLLLNLHRISDSQGSLWKPCPIDVFKEFIKEITNYFEISSFSELACEGDKPKLILSFDDGYLDFYENAVPILEDYSLSCNQNLIPNCLISGRPPLNVVIQDLAGIAPLSMLRSIDWGLRINDFQDIRSELLAYSQKVKALAKAEQKQLENLLYSQGIPIEEFTSAKMMSVEQAKSLPKSVIIGNHSMDHTNADSMELNEWKLDLLRSQNWLNKNFQLSHRIYAFPNGSYSQEHIDVLKQEGFDFILLVGNSSSKVKSDIKKRVNFTPQSVHEGRFDSMRPMLRIL